MFKKMNVVNDVDTSSLTTWPIQNKHRTAQKQADHQDATDIQKKRHQTHLLCYKSVTNDTHQLICCN